MLKEVPENMEELKRKATNQSNWRERLEAVNELKNYDCEQSRSILTNLAIHDSVFAVKEAAFRAAPSADFDASCYDPILEEYRKGAQNNYYNGDFSMLPQTGDGSQFIAGGIHAG